MNFHGLRYVSERCELGEQREALLAVTIPEEKGSFLKFCQLLGGRSVTEFNYRFADAKNACIFVGVRLSRGLEERKEILQMLNDGGYSVVDLSDDEMAKLHVRYMVGGRPSHPLQERLYSFEFPESPGALLRFLNTLVRTGTSRCSIIAATVPTTGAYWRRSSLAIMNRILKSG
ncbi:hypothetical protein ECZU51_38590 [Escherichia coli]|nr:hypothetical protein ECZU51_38590 [Escherichia coli]